MTDEEFMRIAIEEARSGIQKSEGGPFGAAVVKDQEVLSRAHNTVLGDNDPTRHAEITAISRAASALGTHDLSGCEIYSTTEPCPMCLAAIHWARIGRLVYGTAIEDVKKRGFNELSVPSGTFKKISSMPLVIEGGFLKQECLDLLLYWDTLPNKQVY